MSAEVCLMGLVFSLLVDIHVYTATLCYADISKQKVSVIFLIFLFTGSDIFNDYWRESCVYCQCQDCNLCILQRSTCEKFYDQSFRWVTAIYKGFAGKKKNLEPCSLHNSVGKAAVVGLLELARLVAENRRRLADLQILANDHTSHTHRVDLNTFTFNLTISNQYFQGYWSWPPQSGGAGETRIPDVLCTYKHLDVVKYVITGDVKSSEDMKYSHESLFQQAWKQALIGIINSDETYGLLLHPEKATLFHMEVEREEGVAMPFLTTHSESFEFIIENPVHDLTDVRFDTVQFLQLLNRIIGVILKLPQM